MRSSSYSDTRAEPRGTPCIGGHVVRSHRERGLQDTERRPRSCAASYPLTRHATDLLLLAVDQPRPAWVVKRVIESHVDNDSLITSPRYEGRGGHPLLFSATLRGELESITDEGQGVREVFDVHRGEVNEVMFDDPIVRLDLNTPEEYESARAKYGA